MEHDIPLGNSNRENGTTFLDFPLFLGIFQWDEPTKRVPFTAEPEIPEILTKWKAPLVSAYLLCRVFINNNLYKYIFINNNLLIEVTINAYPADCRIMIEYLVH